MKPRIETINKKLLVGKRLTMSFAEYNVADLWKSFIPRRKEITNNISTDLISLVVYPPTHFANFSPTNKFDRWATVEVSSLNNVPREMETFTLDGGLYAVFNYKGLNTDNSIYQYIFSVWLPSSEYNLDHRPHFEVLGVRYKNNDPTSEEEIWIPIKPQNTSR